MVVIETREEQSQYSHDMIDDMIDSMDSVISDTIANQRSQHLDLKLSILL